MPCFGRTGEMRIPRRRRRFGSGAHLPRDFTSSILSMEVVCPEIIILASAEVSAVNYTRRRSVCPHLLPASLASAQVTPSSARALRQPRADHRTVSESWSLMAVMRLILTRVPTSLLETYAFSERSRHGSNRSHTGKALTLTN